MERRREMIEININLRKCKKNILLLMYFILDNNISGIQ